MRCLYSSPFVPPEWIAAHGVEPRRLQAAAPEAMAVATGNGVCPFAAGILARACEASPDDVLVLTTECDQMRRLAEQAGRETGLPVHLLNLPATRTPSARKIFADELVRMSAFLVRHGGSPLEDRELVGQMTSYGAGREALRSVAGRCRQREFSEAVHCFPPAFVPEPEEEPYGIPVAVVGGPLASDALALFDFIEEAGGRVVLDGTETGERTIPAPFEPSRLESEPFDALVKAYFDGIPEVWQRPNDFLYEWLHKAVASRGPAGVILVRNVWCDLWHAEVARLRETLLLPVLDLDLNGEDALTRNRTRLAAFMEILG